MNEWKNERIKEKYFWKSYETEVERKKERKKEIPK